MNQKTGWGKINNCALFDYTVTELCFCNGVENYAKSLNVNSQLQIEKLSRILVSYLFFQIIFARMLAKCQVLTFSFH